MIKEWIPACAGMTERWYGFLMQFTPAKLVPVKAGSRGRDDRKTIKIIHFIRDPSLRSG